MALGAICDSSGRPQSSLATCEPWSSPIEGSPLLMDRRAIFRFLRALFASLQLTTFAITCNSARLGTAQRAGSECYSHSGEPQLCFPNLVNVALLPSTRLWASSTCTVDEAYCFHLPVLSAPTCRRCPSTTSGGRVPAFNAKKLIDNSSSSRWQSSQLTSREEHVVIKFDLRRPFVVFSLTLTFTVVGRPSRALVEVSSDDGTTWRTLAIVAGDCGGGNFAARRLADACITLQPNANHVTVPVLDRKLFFDSASNRTRSAWEQLYRHAVVTNARLTFLSLESNMQITLPNQKGYDFYAMAEFGVWGICHCGGHAGSCSASRERSTRQPVTDVATPPSCSCAHGTTGGTCAACEKPRHQLAGPATLSQADPCEGRRAAVLQASWSKHCDRMPHQLAAHVIFEKEAHDRTGHVA